MIELKGKYNTAKVFNDELDESTISQVIEMCNQTFVKGKQIRIMPDTHAGAGCTIGTTMEVDDYVVPNWVGVDISCGMAFVEIPMCIRDNIEMKTVDEIINKYIPAGMTVHDDEIKNEKVSKALDKLKCRAHIDKSRAMKSIGTLGGGNHFIEIDRSEVDNKMYLVVHCGSRHLGMEVATYYQKLAAKNRSKINDEDKTALDNKILELKAAGRQKEIPGLVAENKRNRETFATGMEPLYGSEVQDYLHDIAIIDMFASENRKHIVNEILSRLGILSDCQKILGKSMICETVHNYIEVIKDDSSMRGILRKGAISAKENELVLIPMNMRDGSLLCLGKGNPDWNCSAPHGAGRLMSRSKAKENISMKDFEESMKGIYTTSVKSETIDEAPMAYKDAASIEKYIADTVDVIAHLIPIYNFKSST